LDLPLEPILPVHPAPSTSRSGANVDDHTVAKRPVDVLPGFECTAAHVDHGKTTLMDQLLRACGVETGTDRFMDSNVLEKERGITISSKYTSMQWRGHVLNAVDTPGHADFGE
jgi:Elongation factor Tu GTP binding domain